MGVQAEPWTPDMPSVHTYEQRFPISEAASYVQRFDLDERNRLVEWAVIQNRRASDGTWLRVAVYDTCHGKGVHLHLYDRNEQEFAEVPLMAVDSHDDLEQGLDYVLERIVVSWRENERRSDRGR